MTCLFLTHWSERPVSIAQPSASYKSNTELHSKHEVLHLLEPGWHNRPAHLFHAGVHSGRGAKNLWSRYMTHLCPAVRSEEHTSELQSLMRNSYADFCLKKQKHKCEQKLI